MNNERRKSVFYVPINKNADAELHNELDSPIDKKKIKKKDKINNFIFSLFCFNNVNKKVHP